MATKNKGLSDAAVRQIITAAVIIVIGVLFCVAISALDVINTLIGIGFIVAGAVLAVTELIRKKCITTTDGITGALMIAFGIAIIILNWLGALASLLILILIVFGAFYIVDSILLITWRNKKNMQGFAVELTLGVVAFVLGMCLWFIPEFRRFADLVFGIILILYGIYLLVDAIIHKK